jgi:fatty-acyl-CoA synthase
VDIAYLLRRAAREFPRSPAVDDGVRTLDLAALMARAERLANALDEFEVPEGACVGILCENRSEYIEADAAIALGRRVRVALNARLHLDDHRYMAADSGMQVLFHSAAHAASATALREELGLATISFDAGDDGSPWYEDLIERSDPLARVRGSDEEAASWITYTSGTTGKPKGVVLSHRAIREVAFNLLAELGPPTEGEQIVLTQALSHGAGYFTLPYLLNGAGVYVLRHFDAEEVWKVSTRDNVRTLKIVPAMLPALMDENGSHWGFRTVVYGASPIPQPVLERALDRFGPSLVQIYGQSEAPVTLTCLHKQDHLVEEARLSAGRPWRSVQVEVRDENGGVVAPGTTGELFVRGRHMMTAYHRKPEATRAAFVDGWIRTQDMAREDEAGFIHLQGRKDDMINSGGYNIAPREVEDVLAHHGAVQEAVVLGMPDERWGSAVTAVVQTRPQAQLTGEQLIEFARPRLGIRTPKRVVFLDDIPRTPYGKIDRVALRTQLSGDRS